MTDPFHTDGRTEGESDFEMPPGTEANGHDPDATPRLQLSPKLTRGQMLENPIQFLCPRSRFLARGVSTLITSMGGVGKTRLMLQLFSELERGEAPFGCEYLRPERPMKCLYIGAEDHQAFFNSAALPLLERDEDQLPFDYILLPEVWPGFTLNRQTAPMLARFLEDYRAEHGLDCAGLDPMMSLISSEYADMMSNPIISRGFFNDCIVPILASQAFALISGNHDSKAGNAVSGSADQQNAARCVLQLSTEGPAVDGTSTINAERHKDNVGFRFTKLVLDRDPETLLLTWNEAQSTFAYGAPAAAKLYAKPPTDAAEVRRYLARQAAKLLISGAPEARRAKRAVTDLLQSEAVRDGLTKVKDAVKSFIEGCCEFEQRKEGRNWRSVLVGVRNPDARLGEHDDFIAGRAAVDDDAAPDAAPTVRDDETGVSDGTD